MTKLHASAVAQSITKQYTCARDASGELYVYFSGCYQADGEQYIKRWVKEFAIRQNQKKSWSSRLAAEVCEYIRADAPALWPSPPPDVVNLPNGLLNVITRELLPHSQDHLTPVQLPVQYDPAADTAIWSGFIDRTFPSDARNLAFEISAWAMTPDTSIQKAACLTGEGGNGKSVYLAGLTAFLGVRNICAVSLHQLENDRFAVSRLVGKLANVCPDLPNQKLASTAMFKAITGGDTIQGERKYRDAFEFRPHAKLIFSANQIPAADDSTYAFHRRWVIVPFERTFGPEDLATMPRAQLDAMLAAPEALSGLLNLALDALPRLRSHGFTIGESMLAAQSEFQRVSDPLILWLQENVVDEPTGTIVKRDLIDRYNRACTAAGRPPMSDTGFGRALRRARPSITDCQVTVNGKTHDEYRGIAWNHRGAWVSGSK